MDGVQVVSAQALFSSFTLHVQDASMYGRSNEDYCGAIARSRHTGMHEITNQAS